jgi:hypothetical protein
MSRIWLVLFVALLVVSPLTAAAVIDGLQFPAWVERGGTRQPLSVGMEINESDNVETGKNGRLLLRLVDGSHVKLGENASLNLGSLQEGGADNSIRGLLSVARGAFRYTAGALGRFLKRDIEVRLATTTIGIRGTDVWGRSQNGGVTVCLIEGRVSMFHPTQGDFVLDEPLSFFIAPAEGEPKPVGPVDPEKLKQWAAETDLDPGKGVMVPGGGWLVQLGAHTDEKAVQRIEKRLREAGIPVERTTVQLKDRTYYRLRVSGFDTQQDARHFAANVITMGGLPVPWVTCNIPGQNCR